MPYQDCLDWVGGLYTIPKFVGEAERQGCCRKIGSWAPWLEPGMSRVFLAHRGTQKRADTGVIFGYFIVAGADLVMSNWRWAEYQRLLAEAESTGDTSPVDNFLLQQFPPVGRPLRDVPEEEDTAPEPAPPARELPEDELVDFLVDLLFDCGNGPPHRRVPAFQCSLEADRVCGCRPFGEYRQWPPPDTWWERDLRSGLYLVDDLAGLIGELFCEILKELIKDAVQGANGEDKRLGRPRFAGNVLKDLHQRLYGKAEGRSGGRQPWNGIAEYDSAVALAQERLGAGLQIHDAIPHKQSCRGSLVVFERPYPKYRRLCNAWFRGNLRIDGDALLDQIAESYKTGRTQPIGLPIYCGPDEGDLTMTDLAARLARRTHLNKELAMQVLRQTAELIGSELERRDTLRISGLGTFTKRVHKGGWAKNPRTQERIQVPDRNRVSFRPAKKLKDRVNS